MPTLNKTLFDSYHQNWVAQGTITDRSHLRSWLFAKAELKDLLQNQSQPIDYVRFYLYESDLQNEESIGLAALAVQGGSATQGGTDKLPSNQQIIVSFHYADNKEDLQSPLYQSQPSSQFQDTLTTPPRTDNQITLEQAQVLIGLYLGTDLNPEDNPWEYPCAKELNGSITRVKAFRFPVASLQTLLDTPEVVYIRQYLATKIAIASLPGINPNENGLATLVMLGTDADGKDIFYSSGIDIQEEEEDTGIFDVTDLCPFLCNDDDDDN